MAGYLNIFRAVVKNPDGLISHRFNVAALTQYVAQRKMIDYLNDNKIHFSDVTLYPTANRVIA